MLVEIRVPPVGGSLWYAVGGQWLTGAGVALIRGQIGG